MSLHEPVLDWYAEHARELPWRAPDRTAWGVLVSEVMLQQTPVARVLPAWRAWMERWPTPSALAGEAPGEAVRMWDRLGYPRRALRLHAAAVAITERHAGRVPATEAELLDLPGVGTYTAAAVAAFAFGAHTVVVDTNVRRVLARAIQGDPLPAPSLTRAETELARRARPGPALSPVWNVAVMELGALICTARSPRCGACPIERRCAWRLAGAPAYDGPPRRGQAWHGTDRQCRGALMAVARAAEGAVARDELLRAWPRDAAQAQRCLLSLVLDGLLEAGNGGRALRLPG